MDGMTQQDGSDGPRRKVAIWVSASIATLLILSVLADLGGATSFVSDLLGRDSTNATSSQPTTDSAGTGIRAADSPSTFTAPTSTPPSSAPPQGDIASVIGTWEGVYRCDTLRGLRLGITKPRDSRSNSDLVATFTFYDKDGNAGSPLGEYAMKGSYLRDNLVLDFDYWIEVKQRGAYYPVNLRGKINVATGKPVLGGKIVETSCATFELGKISDTAELPRV